MDCRLIVGVHIGMEKQESYVVSNENKRGYTYLVQITQLSFNGVHKKGAYVYL